MNEDNNNKNVVFQITKSLMFVSQLVWVVLSPMVLCVGVGYAFEKYKNADSKIMLIAILIGLCCMIRNAYMLYKAYIKRAEAESGEDGTNN